MTFQASATAQGRQFSEQCDLLLTGSGFVLGEHSLRLATVGVEIDRVATSPGGREVWFEYKGSIQGRRPGLLRTDTMKKAIANGALLAAVKDHPRFVVLTSHKPTTGSACAMLATALSLRILDDVICIYDPAETRRLATL